MNKKIKFDIWCRHNYFLNENKTFKLNLWKIKHLLSLNIFVLIRDKKNIKIYKEFLDMSKYSRPF